MGRGVSETGGQDDVGARSPARSGNGGASTHLDALCSDLCEHARAVAARARAVASSPPGTVVTELARTLEDEALRLAALAVPSPGEPPPGVREDRPRLLLAEDDADDRSVLVEALEGDYEVSSLAA